MQEQTCDIGRLLVSCASQARMHTTHDPRHEKVADRRGSLGNSLSADRESMFLVCIFGLASFLLIERCSCQWAGHVHKQQGEVVRMPSAVAAFGGIGFQPDPIGSKFSERIQGGAPQVAMDKRNPLAVV